MTVPTVRGKLAFIFPGQGSQVVGMGRGFHDSWVPAKRAFERMDEVCGAPVSTYCFEGPYEELSRTEHAQPAIFTVSCVALAYALERGLEADVVAGHSLGEYAALVTAGVLDFDSALELVRARAALMRDAASTSDGMAAVLGLAVDDVERELEEAPDVAVANINCPGQVVVSGRRAAIDRMTPRLKEAGAKRVVPMAVCGAFHTERMRPANEKLVPLLEAAILTEARVPVVQNSTARAVTAAVEILEGLKGQMVSPVLWHQCVQTMADMGVVDYVELGPGTVLKGLVERCQRGANAWSVGEPDSLCEVEKMMADA